MKPGFRFKLEGGSANGREREEGERKERGFKFDCGATMTWRDTASRNGRGRREAMWRGARARGGRSRSGRDGFPLLLAFEDF